MDSIIFDTKKLSVIGFCWSFFLDQVRVWEVSYFVRNIQTQSTKLFALISTKLDVLVLVLERLTLLAFRNKLTVLLEYLKIMYVLLE